MSKVAKVLVGAAAIGFAAFTGGVSLAGLGSFLTTGITGRLLTSVALSALSQALVKSQGQKNPGIRSSNTARGDINPDGFILGRYATAGAAVAPPYTHSRSGHKTPNPYLQYVIHLGGAPGQGLAGLLIDGRTTEILGTEIPWDGSTNFGGANDAAGKRREYGREVRIDGSNTIACWVRFVDGTQTAADGRLINRYGNHPDRPWTSAMVGAGISYAIVTFQLEQPLFSGFPQVQFIMDGIRLYDPRKDSTAGGSGAHRWGQPATYERTENTAVQIYNLLRGISLPGGRVYGGRARAAQLPNASWFAAMNACDAAVSLAGGGSEKAWRTSYEISVADEPASVIEELCSAASIQLTEMGGTWKIRVGAPGVPVAWLTDDDIMISHDQTHEQFPGLDKTYNGASINFPDPQSGWQAVEGPIYLRADYAAQDQGRELVADLSLPAAPYPQQNQRLARAYVEEERRFRRHVITLPPDYGALEPLDALAWSSERNGYEDKIFEVVETTTDPVTQLVTASLRERDPEDYDWEPGFELPYSPKPPIWTGPVVVEVGDFAVSGLVITDADGVPRRPAILLTWDTDDLQDVDGLEWEVRLSGATDPLLRGSITDVTSGRLVIAEGILPNEAYQVRARMVGKAFDNIWSVWLGVVAPNVGLGERDIAEEVLDEMRDIAAQAGIETVTTLPATGRPNQIVLKLPEGVLHRWDAAAGQWVKSIYAGIAPGSLTATEFANNIKPIEIVDVLPGAPHVKGRQVFLTTDNQTYRNTGSGWTVAVPAVNVTGTLTNSQIANGAISVAKFATGIEPVGISTAGTLPTVKTTNALYWQNKLYRWNGTAYVASVPTGDLVGQVTSTQITDNAITTAKIAANAITANEIAANAVTADAILANSITTGKIAAGAVTATEIAANAITAQQMAIADFSNPLIGSETQATSGFIAGPGSSWTTAIGYNGKPTSMLIQGNQTGGFSWVGSIPVNPGEEYYVELMARRSSVWDGTNANSKLRFGRVGDNQQIFSVGYGASEMPSATWTKLSGSFTVPANTPSLSVVLGNDATTGQMYLSDLVLRRKNGGELIVDGAVTAVKVAANAITAGKIAANAVTSDTIAANAITSDKIDANAITAGKIAAGAVGADQIAANAISAKQLLVMDFTNLILDPDYSAENSGYWNLLGTTSAISRQPTPSNMQRPTAVVIADTITAGTGVRVQPGTPIPVSPGEQWYVSARVRASGTSPNATMALIAYWYATPNVAGPGAGSSPDRTYVNTGVQLLDHTFTVPDGAAFVSFGYVRRSNSGQSGSVWVNQMSARRVNGGELIVDGAITANKISAGAVTTDALLASAVIASKIAAGAVTTDKLLANAVTAVKIDTDAIEARHIRSKQVTAEAMAANSITAANGAIADLSVDTLQIRGNAVTVSAFADAPGNVFLGTTARITLASVAISRAGGYSTAISISFQWRSPPDSSVGVYLYRGSTLVRTWYASSQANIYTDAGMFTVSTIDDNTGSGATTYSLQASRLGSGTVAAEASLAFISATQFKR